MINLRTPSRRRVYGTIAGLATLGFVAASSQAAVFPIANFGGGVGGATDVSFVSDGVGGGTLVITAHRDVSNAAGTTIPGATINLTTTLVAHSATQTGSLITAQFVGGSFSVKKGGTTLLGGNFVNPGLISFVPGAFSFQAQTIAYTSNGIGAENFVDVFEAFHGCEVGDGNLSFSATAVAPSLTTYVTGMGRGLNNFTSQLSGNFDAECVAVPEPSEWAAMGLGALSVGGLMVRARRRRKNFAA